MFRGKSAIGHIGSQGDRRGFTSPLSVAEIPMPLVAFFVFDYDSRPWMWFGAMNLTVA